LRKEGFPTHVVIPLPKGQYFDASALWLQEIPSQTIALERWRGDGSLRHVLVHFIADTSVNQTTYQFGNEARAKPALSKPVVVTQTSTQVTVNTGKIQFSVNKKKNFNLFDKVWVDYNKNGIYEPNEQIVSSKTKNGGRLVNYLGKVKFDANRVDVTVTV
jgi:hypothetical protein